jgi:diguanylate cyclase (GGDEF)-like protein
MSDEHFQVLFEYAPVALWEQDFSGIKSFLGPLQAQGVTDFDSYLDQHPEAVEDCISAIRSIKLNRRMVDLFGANTENELFSSSGSLYRDDMSKVFREGLRAIWKGNCSFKQEGIVYSLNGNRVEVSLEWIVVPGYEESLKKVLITIREINEQKKAEMYIKYLGTHDVLTGLYNRAYLEEERNRLEHSRKFPITIIIADLDGLKKVNEALGHIAGDDLIKRSAELLRTAFRAEDVVARIGGGEFAIIMPTTDLSAAEQSLERIRDLIREHNRLHPGLAINISLGAASGEKGARLLNLQREANNRMYLDKRSKSLRPEI